MIQNVWGETNQIGNFHTIHIQKRTNIHKRITNAYCIHLISAWLQIQKHFSIGKTLFNELNNFRYKYVLWISKIISHSSRIIIVYLHSAQCMFYATTTECSDLSRQPKLTKMGLNISNIYTAICVFIIEFSLALVTRKIQRSDIVSLMRWWFEPFFCDRKSGQ